MTLNKDWLLYLNMSKNLYVLDVSKWLDWYFDEDVKKSHTRPEFKLAYSRKFVGRFDEFRYMIANSEPYVVGGRSLPNYLVKVEERANLAVDVPLIVRVRPPKLPHLSAPKLDPCVVTIDGKIYVLSTRIFDGCIKDKKPPLLFEALYPGSHDWKVLPNPPFIIGRTLNSSCPFISHCGAWGQKLIVKDPVTGKNYIFNTDEEKWEEALDIPDATVPCSAQFKQFLVSVEDGHVYAYRFDEANGTPRRVAELVQLEKIIFRYPSTYPPSITNFGDDGLMSIVCSGIFKERRHHKLSWARVVVFQLCIEGLPPNQSICVDIKAKGTFYIDSEPSPSFIQNHCRAYSNDGPDILQLLTTRDDWNKYEDWGDVSCRKKDILPPWDRFPLFGEGTEGTEGTEATYGRRKKKRRPLLRMMKLQPMYKKIRVKRIFISDEDDVSWP
ncbi:uncharacterized protein LOC126627353 [Malus sylvestris]|uniref:uncharacterized protein LOC126627353 n=1 Tax=Malus sylvestris TaxID=3752 RepID=UPI0021AC93E5|nr:uncharacterized protein LOC126627353 [Malus sylvestris]